VIDIAQHISNCNLTPTLMTSTTCEFLSTQTLAVAGNPSHFLSRSAIVMHKYMLAWHHTISRKRAAVIPAKG